MYVEIKSRELAKGKVLEILKNLEKYERFCIYCKKRIPYDASICPYCGKHSP